MDVVDPTLCQATTNGTWFGAAPTIVGVLLAVFWAIVLYLKQPVERLHHRLAAGAFLVLALSVWLGYNGEGGQIGGWFAEGLESTPLAGFAFFLVVVAALASTPLATDWFGVPLYSRLQASRALRNEPVRGSVGKYEVRGGFMHDDVAPAGADASPAASAASTASIDDGAMMATATLEIPEVEASPARSAYGGSSFDRAPAADDLADVPPREYDYAANKTASSAVDAPSRVGEADETVDDDEDLPWYARRRARRPAADDELAERREVVPPRSEVPEVSEQVASDGWGPVASEGWGPVVDDVVATASDVAEVADVAEETVADANDAVETAEARADDWDGTWASEKTPIEHASGEDGDWGSAVATEDEVVATADVAEVAEVAEVADDVDEEVEDVAEVAEVADEEVEDVVSEASVWDSGATTTDEVEPPEAEAEIEESESTALADEDPEAEEDEDVWVNDVEDVEAETDEWEEEAEEEEADDELEGDEETVDLTVEEEPAPEVELDADEVEADEVDEAPAAAPASPAREIAPEDALFFQAGDLVVSSQRASISFLQRSLGIGYFQAAKLLDRLQGEQVIGPYTGAVNREVLMAASAWERRKEG